MSLIIPYQSSDTYIEYYIYGIMEIFGLAQKPCWWSTGNGNLALRPLQKHTM